MKIMYWKGDRHSAIAAAIQHVQQTGEAVGLAHESNRPVAWPTFVLGDESRLDATGTYFCRATKTFRPLPLPLIDVYRARVVRDRAQRARWAKGLSAAYRRGDRAAALYYRQRVRETSLQALSACRALGSCQTSR